MDLLKEANELQTELTAWRRQLHAEPETGFDLHKTLPFVEESLHSMGLRPRRCGRAGLTVTLGRREGKCILLRADMDALPLREESGLSFASSNGAMHACGHDLHTAMLLGAAKLLTAHEAELRGCVKLMFQPAEETFEGAKDMIAGGVLEEPKVDAAVMLHVLGGMPLPVGTVIVCAPGVSAPAADYFEITVRGKGCHGSAPQQGVDALTAAAHILLGLQELNARELGADEAAVLTVGTLSGGTAGNIIADSARMEGTLRTYDEAVRARLKERMEEIAVGLAAAYRARAEVRFGTGCPTLVNDETLCAAALRHGRALLGEQAVRSAAELRGRGGGSEDFAYISHKVPAVMLSLAAGGQYPQHHPAVTFDETVLSVGAALYAKLALGWLAEN